MKPKLLAAAAMTNQPMRPAVKFRPALLFAKNFVVVLLFFVAGLPFAASTSNPEIRDSSEATVFVNGDSDYFEFAPGWLGSTGHQWIIVAPDGSTAVVTRTSQDLGLSETGGAQRWHLSGRQVSGTPSAWAWTGSLHGAAADGTWRITSNQQPDYESDSANTGGPFDFSVVLAVQGRSIRFNDHVYAPGSGQQVWNWHRGSWVEPNHGDYDVDTPNEGPQEDPQFARFFGEFGGQAPVGSCPSGQVGYTVGDTEACVQSCDWVEFIGSSHYPCQYWACETAVGDSYCATPLPCGDTGEWSCETFVCAQAVGNPTCEEPKVCEGEPIAECLHLRVCENYDVNCLPGSGERMRGPSGLPTPSFVAINGLAAASKYASSSSDPGEARCFVYATTSQQPADYCKGSAAFKGHLNAYGMIYCVQNNDCSTTGTIHTAAFSYNTTDPYSPSYEVQGFTQFYAGFGTGCPEPSGDCAMGDWTDNVQWVVGTSGQATYTWDISKSGYNRYNNGGPCHATGEYHPMWNPDPVYMCPARGGYGAFAYVVPNE